MAKLNIGRRDFVDPRARLYTCPRTGFEVYLRKDTRTGFMFAQLWKPRATRNFETIAHNNPHTLKQRVRAFLSDYEAHKETPLTYYDKNHQKKTFKPSQNGWKVSDYAKDKPRTTSLYKPLNPSKRSVFERAKRALFG